MSKVIRAIMRKLKAKKPDRIEYHQSCPSCGRNDIDVYTLHSLRQCKYCWEREGVFLKHR